MKENLHFEVQGFNVSIIEKPAFGIIGFTRFVKLDGKTIHSWIEELTQNGKMAKLAGILGAPRQIWVCLSGNEGVSDADCRCTVCVEREVQHDFSVLSDDELFTMRVPASSWALFELNSMQTPRELHEKNVYRLISEIGYSWNDAVGLHLDNEHEWQPGKTMSFLLPVKGK